MGDAAPPVFTGWLPDIAESPMGDPAIVAPPTLVHGSDAPSCSTAEWLLLPTSPTSHDRLKSLSPHADYGEFVLRGESPFSLLSWMSL